MAEEENIEDRNSKISAIYLSVCLDKSLHFLEHVQRIIQKAGDTTRTLSRIMSNLYDPSFNRRKL